MGGIDPLLCLHPACCAQGPHTNKQTNTNSALLDHLKKVSALKRDRKKLESFPFWSDGLSDKVQFEQDER